MSLLGVTNELQNYALPPNAASYLETISLMRRIALTGTDEDKAAAEQILGSAKREVEKADQHKEE